MGKKLFLIGLPLVCILCLLLACGFFGLFGYFESDGDCKYTGPLASVPEDSVCFEEDESDSDDSDDVDSRDEDSNDEDSDERDEVQTFEGEEYTGEFFKFNHPTDWFVDDSTSVLYLYVEDPESVQDFYENVNMQRFTLNDLTDISDSQCEMYGEGVVGQLDGVYDVVNLDDSDSTRVGTMDACQIVISGSINGTSLEQTQYYAVDSDDESVSYIITLTYLPNSQSLDDMKEVVESFRLI